LAWLGTLVSPDVSAQTGSGGTGGSAAALTKSDFTFYLQYYDPGQKSWIVMNQTQQTYFLNRARCECDGDTTNYTGYFRIAIEPASSVADKIRNLLNQNLVGSGSARLYAGGNVVNCLSPSSATAGTYSSYCMNLINPSDPSAGIVGGMATFAATRVWHSDPLPVAWLFNAANYPVCSGSACDATASCTTTSATVTIYFWTQTTAMQLPDMTDSSFNVNLVGQSAFAPDNVAAEGANEALTVSWSWPGGLNPAGNASFLGVQLFCERAPDFQVFKSGTFSAAFMTSAATCPGVAPAPSGDLAFANLDPSYLCSGLLPSTTTSYHITRLENGVTYGVGVAGVDKFGNLSPIAPADVVYASPVPGVGGSGDSAGFAHAQGCSCAVSGQGDGHGPLASLGWLGLGMLLLCRARSKAASRTKAWPWAASGRRLPSAVGWPSRAAAVESRKAAIWRAGQPGIVSMKRPRVSPRVFKTVESHSEVYVWDAGKPGVSRMAIAERNDDAHRADGYVGRWRFAAAGWRARRGVRVQANQLPSQDGRGRAFLALPAS
jgi:hypothetical protein